ncbi:MAG: N-acetyltransferase [Actinomycetia bacterium]|nr:N-acetyltransferase [Actinomycetes bacterium]MCP4085745.1 N-acetyltransferase [Actinomycetes bacterium]
MGATLIRRASVDDLARITEIYNQYIVDSHVSFDTKPWNLERRREWWELYDSGDGPWQVWVAEVDGRVVGASWSSRFRPRTAYDSSVETTIVFDPGVTGRGLGGRLYEALLDDLDHRGVHRQYAIIALPNDASVALHHRMGYKTQAVQDEVGHKMGRYWSTMLLERIPPGREAADRAQGPPGSIGG